MSNINLYNQDCMEAMAKMSNRAYQLAICDPPYGIGNFIPQGGKQMGNNFGAVTWNDSIPPPEYFSELKRISEKQIIWGANYYNCFTGGAIVWDKMQQNPQLSRCEIASVSFGQRVAYVQIAWAGFLGAKMRAGIHPCEKPVRLYEWLLKNYAKEGDKILDTHCGSGSILIACDIMGYDIDAYEIDLEYYTAAKARLTRHQSQGTLFTADGRDIA